MLVEFRDRGFVKSMIVITHDLSVLYQIADTILVMYAGKLAEKAPAETIVDAPQHPYTQLLLDSLPEVGVRYAEQRLARHPGPAAVAPRSAGRLPLPRPLPARLRAVRGGAAVRRRSTPGHSASPAGRRSRLMLPSSTPCSKTYRRARSAAASCSPSATSRSRVAPGEVVSLIGESGSGKSTIGKMILQLAAADARARSRFDGVDISASRAGS